MANEEHLQILLQGTTAWNHWRERNPDIQPDLRRANLVGADLRRMNLRRADFSGERFSRGANLSEADLASVRSA